MQRKNTEEFDPLLSTVFFQLPSHTRSTLKLNFPLPADQKRIKDFFKEQGEQFYTGVKTLVNQLKSLADEQGIVDSESELALTIFLEKCQLKPDATEFYIQTVFPLFTQGVFQLAEIVDILKQDKIWSDSKKDIIRNLLHHMSACGPGVGTYIYDTRLALEEGLLSELMSFRRILAEQIAGKVVLQHNSDNVEIAEGSEVHYINALLNLHAKQLGIVEMEDVYAKDCPPTEQMKAEFLHSIMHQLTASYIIDSLMQKNKAMLEKAKPSAEFIQWLGQFGSDSKFSIELVAQADDDDVWHFKPNTEFYIQLAIFFRLMNSDLFDRSHVKKHKLASIPSHHICIPTRGNITLAYVEPEDKYKTPEPFILYYFNQLLRDAVSGDDMAAQLEKLCDDAQKDELKADVVTLFLAEWPNYAARHSPEEQQTLLLYFNRKFSSFYLQLIETLKTSHLSDNQKQSLALTADLKNKILHDKRLDCLLGYLELFPAENWLTIILEELQGMDLLSHRPVQRTIELLASCSRLNVGNVRLLLYLFSNQGDGSVVPVDYLDQLFNEFKQSNLDEYLIDSLSAAESRASHLAKAIYLVKDAGLINEKIMQFLNNHPANADYLAEILILYHGGIKIEIDDELLDFLAQHEVLASKFVECIHDESLLNWVTFFMDGDLLNKDRLMVLFLKSRFIHGMISALSTLYILDADLVSENFDVLLSRIEKPNQANFIKFVAQYCKEKEMRFEPDWINLILSHKAEYPLAMNNELLASYADTLGMTTLVESLRSPVAAHLGRFGQFAAPVVAEDDAHPIAPQQPGFDND